MRSLIILAAAVIPAAAQKPTVRLIDAPTIRSKVALGNVVGVRQVSSGALLVNDSERRQVLLLDASLGSATVVIDSANGAANAYGPRAGGLIPWRSDSSAFIDPVGLSMFVIDAAGKMARVASIPRSQDAPALTSTINGWPDIDGEGRLVYRGQLTPQRAMNGGMTMGQSPDSLEIVRVDVATRKLDTAGFVKIPKVKITVTQTEKGMTIGAEVNPVQTVDDWAVLSDGSIAIVRGLDYHVDIIAPDGRSIAGPKVPFEWQPLSDEDKVALLDSLKRVMERPATSGQPGAVVMHGGGGGPPGGHVLSSVTLAPVSALPDYRPPFNQGASRGDADGNLWVRTTAKRAGAIGGPIYDVIDKTGTLIDRVQIPAGRQIVGFGRGGVVYLVGSDEKGDWIEQTKR